MIIAEAGVNHNGKLGLALKLVDRAVAAGADVVKFQTFVASSIATGSAPKATYQLPETKDSTSQREMLERLELSHADHSKIHEYCQSQGIQFASTAFDKQSLDLLSRFELPFYKIPSGEITNLPLLRQIGGLGNPVVLSTGASTLSEVENAVRHLRIAGSGEVTLLHCTSAYPARYEDVNIRAMTAMGKALGLPFGYSDHTLGIEVAIAAAALGATVIEKHLTLDRSMSGPDHKASLEPDEFTTMVSCIRNVTRALGDGIKRPTPTELQNIPVIRRSIVAARSIVAGELFSEENISVKRPAGGISPMDWDLVIGRESRRNYSEDEWID